MEWLLAHADDVDGVTAPECVSADSTNEQNAGGASSAPEAEAKSFKCQDW